MNKANKKQLANYLKELNEIYSRLEAISTKIGEYAEEEQEKYDNAPDNLLLSNEYQEIECNAEELSDIYDTLETVIIFEFSSVLESLKSFVGEEEKKVTDKEQVLEQLKLAQKKIEIAEKQQRAKELKEKMQKAKL